MLSSNSGQSPLVNRWPPAIFFEVDNNMTKTKTPTQSTNMTKMSYVPSLTLMCTKTNTVVRSFDEVTIYWQWLTLQFDLLVNPFAPVAHHY